ncbi:serine/threonine/tyrosine-interacting protein isoform X2 [Andrena cerasifolii]|uniref:serine/threonine/tyrosine-interacting protein isoform X2 n=1 Tax=Andrena cerasifolii TaxID=2819439 RepID=UPI0040377025
MLFLDSNEARQDEESASENGSDDYPRIPISMDEPKEWTYTMRRHMQEVVPGLYLGPYSAAIRSKLQCLLEHGITHIVYLVLDIADTATENIIHHFQQVKAFIDEGLNSGGQVLVHSNAGISRSAALVLAYVMETYGLSQTRAYAMVQQKRFCINPNEGFMAQLREYEPIYQAQKILRNGQQSSVRQRSKRTIHQMDTERVEDRCDEMDS